MGLGHAAAALLAGALLFGRQRQVALEGWSRPAPVWLSWSICSEPSSSQAFSELGVFGRDQLLQLLQLLSG